jgi:glycosyltransferase involved in cell wall biosynthesis
MYALIVDQGFLAPFGHHANFNRAMHDGFASHGLQTIHLVHRQCAEPLTAGLTVGKLFRHSPYVLQSADPVCADLENFMAHATAFEADAANIPREVLNDVAVVFLSVPTPATLLGYATWWSALDPQIRRRTVAYMTMNSGLAATDPLALQVNNQSNRTALALFRFVGKQIAAFDPARFAVLAPTDVLADDFAFLLGVPVHVAPIQMAADLAKFDPIAEAYEQSSAPPTVGYFGDGLIGKGFDQLPEIAEGVLAGDRNVRLKIQINTLDWSNYETFDRITRTTIQRIQDIASREPRLTILSGFSAIDRYYTELAECDILLQPYVDVLYARCVSGVFTEAAFLGRAAVAPESTWIARQIALLGGHGASYDGHAPQAAVAATLGLLKRIRELRAAAPSVRRAWRRLHGTDKMIQRILTVGAPVGSDRAAYQTA